MTANTNVRFDLFEVIGPPAAGAKIRFSLNKFDNDLERGALVPNGMK